MRAYRPDRVVRALTALVSVAYFGMLVLALVVLIGLPTVKLVSGNDPDWEIGLPVTVSLLGSDATVLTHWGDARLEVEDVRGSIRLPLWILPWWLFAILWIYFAAAMALTLTFLHHLRRIFQRVRSGAPFDAANATRLRWLGFVALALALLGGVAESVTSLAVKGSVIGERVDVPLGLAVDGSLVLFGLVLLALAEIFRRGAELEYEQSLTV